MIVLLMAAALHVTPPEVFFCDDLHGETMNECVSNAKRWLCRPGSTQDSDGELTDHEIAVVMAERQVLCMRTHLARRYGRRARR